MRGRQAVEHQAGGHTGRQVVENQAGRERQTGLRGTDRRGTGRIETGRQAAGLIQGQAAGSPHLRPRTSGTACGQVPARGGRRERERGGAEEGCRREVEEGIEGRAEEEMSREEYE